MKCKHCGASIHFNSGRKKWVTEKDHWKCGNDPDFPVKSHSPNFCSICSEPYDGKGNNAQPINNGRCCDNCNQTKVMPLRV